MIGALAADSPVPVQVWFMQLQDGPEGPNMQLACAQEYPATITAIATSGTHGAAICAGADTCSTATWTCPVPGCGAGIGSGQIWQPAAWYVVQSRLDRDCDHGLHLHTTPVVQLATLWATSAHGALGEG